MSIAHGRFLFQQSSPAASSSPRHPSSAIDEYMRDIPYQDELEEPDESQYGYDTYHQAYYEQEDGKGDGGGGPGGDWRA